jgi:hypothetical protein
LCGPRRGEEGGRWCRLGEMPARPAPTLTRPTRMSAGGGMHTLTASGSAARWSFTKGGLSHIGLIDFLILFRKGSELRLNMDLDLQSLFGLIWVYLY